MRKPNEPQVSFVAWCLCASIVCLVADGAIRKWVYQDGTASFQAITYFAKDVPLVLALLYSWMQGGKNRLGSLQSMLVVGTLAILAGSAVTFPTASAVGGVVSLRSLLLLPWLAFYAGPHCRGARDLHAVGITIGICAGLNAFLGASQFALPTDHVLNQQTSSVAGAIGDVGRVRASGTFAFISGMAAMCIAACWAGTAMILRNRTSPLGYAVVLAGLGCTSAAVSRSGAFIGLILVVFPLQLKRGGRAVLIAFGVVAAVVYVVSGSSLGDVNTEEASLGTAVIARSQTADSFDERSDGTFSQVPDAVARYPLGTGLGRAQASAGVVSGIEAIYEFELARIVYEIGLLGLIGASLTRVGFFLEFFRAWKLGREPAGAATGMVFSGLSLVLTLVFDHNVATFWAVAMTVCLGSILRSERPIR